METFTQETTKTRILRPEKENTLQFLRGDSFFTWLLNSIACIAIFLAILSTQIMSANILTFLWTAIILHFAVVLGLFMSEEKVDKKEAIIPNEPGEKYLVTLGNEVKKFYGDAVKSAKAINNQTRPLLVNAETVKRHFLCMATIGAGKSVFMKGVMEQYIALGGGLLCVDGKGTDEFAREIFGLVSSLGREDDFVHLNFLDMSNTHTINPLLSGNANTLFEIMQPLLIGEEDNWKSKAKEFMLNVLKLCVWKRDHESDFVFDFSYLTKIMNMTTLSRLGLEYKHLAQKNNRDYDTGVEDYIKWLTASLSIDLDEFLNADPNDPNYIKKIEKASNNTDLSGVYTAGVSIGYWTKPLTTLGSDYGRIFNAPNPSISLWEATQRNKIIFVTLPTMDSDTTPKELGRLILSLIKAVAAKKAQDADEPTIPFLCCLDELGSYVVEGFGRLESKSRSLGISVFPFFQSPAQIDVVAKNDYERKEMIDVTGVHILMKNMHPETTEFYAKMTSKIKVLTRQHSERREGAKTPGNSEDSYQFEEKDAIEHDEVVNINNGELIMFANGKMHRGVARAESSLLSHGKKTTYDHRIPITEYVPKNLFFTEIVSILKKPAMQEMYTFFTKDGVMEKYKSNEELEDVA
ncbi:type IV secretory system conjugative DNA transfer family protein [Campylobacter jejuni]|nr:TraM recognition domain-containing protein [Campylobacter jejuni]EGR9265281.1 type IV secretory system conjugative DNA transfer family protein [Campylobacter jejuni]